VSRVQRACDGATDGLVAAFAIWTIGYEVAVVTESSVWTWGAVWLAVAGVLVVAGAATHVEHGPRSPALPAVPVGPAPVLLALGLLLAVAVVARREVTPLPAVVLGVSILVLGIASRRHSRPTGGEPARHAETSARGTALVLVTCAAAAVLASFLRRPDADDAFYVNRSTWVAEHGVPVVRDTMFGPETFPSTYGRGLPFPSYEALLGALAHLLDVRAAALTYLVVTPVLAFASTWVMWRLVRAWAPARALLVFLVTILVTLISGDTIVGGYGLARMWQGKVVAFAILSPLIWVYLTATVTAGRRGGRRALFLLLCSGIAYAGLTSGAPLLLPAYAGAALIAALLLRNGRLALGAGLLLVGPAAAAASVLHAAPNFTRVDVDILSPNDALDLLLGVDAVFAVVGALAISLAVRWLRPEAVVLASCGSLVAFVALVPGVFELADAVTGAGAIAWRLVILVPLAVLTGLLLVETVRRVPTTAGRVVVTVVLAGVLGVAGTPLWQEESTSLAQPGWKVDPRAHEDVEQVLDLERGPGTLLLPAEQSQVLAVSTTRSFATVPRVAYVANLDEPEEHRSARYALYQWLNEDYALIPKGIRDRLDLLGVAVACVPAEDEDLAGELVRVADESGGVVVAVGSMSCAVRRGSSWA
jgi:hypothetical protein